MKRHVLVTGATGFLGSHVLKALASRPDVEVIAACRDPSRLPLWFHGAVRRGDLTDPAYRRALVEGIDVLCHAGTWGAFWGHARSEDELFLRPALDLIEQFEQAGGKRFLLASTVALSTPTATGTVDDFSEGRKTGFWPHLDRLIDVDRELQRRASPKFVTINMRLGHFVGVGNRLGLVPALVPA